MKQITDFENKIMKNRGFASKKEMLAFLNKNPEELPKFSSLHNGSAILGGISKALDDGLEITIYGDYDCDGVMAMTILHKGLSRLASGKINWFANDRFINGYSITVNSLECMLNKFPNTDVIITCDNGIGAVEAWEEALSRGIKVFVTDHHEQDIARVPDPSIPIVCENSIEQLKKFKQESRNAEGFCGAELARRLIVELYEIRGIVGQNRKFLDSLLAYAGIATIADVISLNASNHCVARAAVDIIRSDKGFWQLFNSIITNGRVKQSEIDGDTFGFYYAPAINACSRVKGNVDIPMKVFLSDDADTDVLADLIVKMNDINSIRKEWTEQDKQRCEHMIKENDYGADPFILIADSRLREGINGLSAGEITKNYGVPSIVLGRSKIPGVLKGSARSVDSVNIYEKLCQCSDILENFGGHPKAAGLSIKEENIEEFRKRMTACVAKDLIRKEISTADCDFTIEASLLNRSYIQKLNKAIENLQPFGEGFRKPVIYLEADVDPSDNGIIYMSDGMHAKLLLKDKSADGQDIWILMWRKGNKIRKLLKGHEDKMVHISGLMHNPEVNDHNGKTSYQMTPDKIEFKIISKGAF